MRCRIIFFIKYGLSWVLYFLMARVFFLLYNFEEIDDFSEVAKSFYYGFKMDLSITSYMLMLVGLMLAGTVFSQKKIIYYVLKYFTVILIIAFSFLVIVDLELYRNWGFRIDRTIFLYLETPKEALLSTPIIITVLLLLFAFVYIYVSFTWFKKMCFSTLERINKTKWYYSIFFVLISAIMIIPIRGGLKLAPMNVGSVYYSSNQFCNHTAINPIWNFLESLASKDSKMGGTSFYNDNKSEVIFASLMLEDDSLSDIELLKLERPNVIILILESFTAKAIGVLGGEKGITPNLDRLSKEGVLFEHCIANGNRSDKGIVSILSGYPAQPQTSIIMNSKKNEKLPNLGREFKNLGYTTSFYYGGDINFSNMNAYFFNGGYDNIITDSEFPKSQQNSKWGAFDEFSLNKLFEDIKIEKQKFFKVLFTITSHEPFEVPKNHTTIFEGRDDREKFLNSINYTDKCIGDFIEKSKKEPWYDNTLIILVADHGHRLPDKSDYNRIESFKIPMIWLGGALKKNGIKIKKYVNQSDIPMILGNQMKVPFKKEFKFSKDIFRKKESFAFYAFNNGIAFFTDNDMFIWDDNAKEFLERPQFISTEEKGKAYLQELAKDYNEK